MIWEEFECLTVKRCLFCEQPLNPETDAKHTRLIYTCKCGNIKAIFQNHSPKNMYYLLLHLPNYAARVMISREKVDDEFTVAINSWSSTIVFLTHNVKVWLQDEHKIKSKIDSLMVLK